VKRGSKVSLRPFFSGGDEDMDSQRRKQRFIVFLSRARVAVGLLVLVFACGASTILLSKDTVSEASLAVPDEITLLDAGFAKLRPALPRGQVVCFQAGPGIPDIRATLEHYVAQYSLAPSLLTVGSKCEFVIQICFQGPCFHRGPRIFGFVDFPVLGATVSGTVHMQGWVVSDSGVKKVCVLVDHKQITCTEDVNLPRIDVGIARPDIKDSGISGWIVSLDSKSLSNGSHGLIVEATSNSEQTQKLGDFKFSVAN
jgi:hypothetical protein